MDLEEKAEHEIKICTAYHCEEIAIGDYNGIGAYACEYHMNKWDKEFEEEYD